MSRQASPSAIAALLVLLVCGPGVFPRVAAGQSSLPPQESEKPATKNASETDNAAPEPDSAAGSSVERTKLNLLGEIDTAGGEARRNENVRLTLIDNNVLKELNRRLGASANVIKEFKIDENYFGKEFGGRPEPSLHLPPPRVRALHGSAFWSHDNSVFSARSFFQVGGVQPAHTNDYGVRAGIPLWQGATLSFEGSQRRLRGQVNGNVLVPAADERTPLATDPATRKIVEAIFGAYPNELPNRTDINPRALNTNAPQNINNDRIGGTLDQALGEKDRLVMRYHFTLQRVEAFQLVGGQNPDTTTRNHQARLTWTRAWSPATTTDFSIGYERIGSLLVPEETSLGPFFLFSRELESIGPGGNIPIDRAQNIFRYGGRLHQVRGSHTLTLGFELLRHQINGLESEDHRGMFSFRADFGRDLMTNLRLGTPSVYRVAIGNVYRGFRNWKTQLYVGDDWRATGRFTVSAGLRYEPVSRPGEVNQLSEIPYSSDLNNFAPRLGLAYRLPGQWGTMRASYGLFYGQIFPATYMQARFNPPGNLMVSVRAPDIADPLKEFTAADLDPTARSSIYQLDPELSTPYSHLYDFSWEFALPRNWTLELGYVGSRSHRLLVLWSLNRARIVEGIPLTSRTVNRRRPDPRYFDVKRILNGSRGYFDAAKVTLRVPRWAGFSIDASYWFSKALDIGADYTATASGRDGRGTTSPSEFNYQKAMKGLSRFDQPHAMLARVNYETPALSGQNRWLRRMFGRWQVSSVLLLKSGTPFGLRSGSDAPGWGNVDGASNDNLILLDPSVLGRSLDNPDTSVQRLPRSAFTTIQPTDREGNLGRNTFRKDGVANLNMGLSRRWSLTGEQSLLFRAESLNFLNHPQFAEPGHSFSSPDFGVISNTLNDGRTFRFTLQLEF